MSDATDVLGGAWVDEDHESSLRSDSPPNTGEEGQEEEEAWSPRRLPCLSPGDVAVGEGVLAGLPGWVTDLRPHQVQALCEVIDAYRRGADAVFLDGPTGSGKTLVGEMVRRVVGGQALYVCHSLGLQDQFLTDFPYARVIKGAANYPTLDAPFPEVTCGDCTGPECAWCEDVRDCPYKVARGNAEVGELAVLNTSYFLTVANHVGRFTGRRLVIVDEADTLEQSIMGGEEFRLTKRIQRQLNVWAPAKGAHTKTVTKWMNEDLKPAVKREIEKLAGIDTVEVVRERQGLQRLHDRITVVAARYGTDQWVRCYDHTDGFVLKPVIVDQIARQKVWRHGELWLLMSATLVSTQELRESLGMGGMRVETVTMPMTFPVENRPIYIVPVARMTAKTKEEAYPQMAAAIQKVLDRHGYDERVLVHTVNYDLAQYLWKNVQTDRQKFTYQNSREREGVLDEYRRRQAAVMFAPSLDRGYDFKDDDARVVIVAKLPYPNLGDQQISKRLNDTEGGQLWYSIATLRTLIQMTGRGVRSASDTCTTYILDAGFMSNIWKKSGTRRLLPEWWREAVRMDLSPRQL